MEMKTVQIINNICQLDMDIQAIVLLKLNETISWLYDNIEDDRELEECLKRLVRKEESISYSRGILCYCGFSEEEDTAREYINKYNLSNEANRMDTLKKQLIEWAIKVEEFEKES
jgi:hypothetical protein